LTGAGFLLQGKSLTLIKRQNTRKRRNKRKLRQRLVKDCLQELLAAKFFVWYSYYTLKIYTYFPSPLAGEGRVRGKKPYEASIDLPLIPVFSHKGRRSMHIFKL
jgi:hypothetical protein